MREYFEFVCNDKIRATTAWTRWLYCVECPQYSIRFEALGCLCTSCL